jgi:hypothetical protein
VPYISKWSGEEAAASAPVVVRGGRLAYADEQPYDRDRHGVLWTRTPSFPGRGRPEFGAVHSLRQRRAMRRVLCQVCGGPADRDADGVLWLLGEDAHDPASWPDDLLTSHPPLCVPCATTAVQACPHLSAHFVALRVRTWTEVGVRGALYRPAWPAPAPVDVVAVTYDDPLMNWVRAGQLIVRLEDYAAVDLGALA